MLGIALVTTVVVSAVSKRANTVRSLVVSTAALCLLVWMSTAWSTWRMHDAVNCWVASEAGLTKELLIS